MDLAKPCIDVGVMTNRLEPMLTFWQQTVGLPFEQLLPLGGGLRQHRHAMNGSVFKLNHTERRLPEVPATGYRELWIATDGIGERIDLVDPDGNRVVRVPRGEQGVAGIAVHLVVSDEAAFHQFYGTALGLERDGDRAYRCGDSILAFSADASAPRSPGEPGWIGRGYRYLTIQVREVDREHHGVLARGGREARSPVTLGAVARVSFVLDPDGNWIEISQRASLVGSLAASS